MILVIFWKKLIFSPFGTWLYVQGPSCGIATLYVIGFKGQIYCPFFALTYKKENVMEDLKLV